MFMVSTKKILYSWLWEGFSSIYTILFEVLNAYIHSGETGEVIEIGLGTLPRDDINLWLSSENDQRFMATRNQIQCLKDSSSRSVDSFN